MTTSGPRLSYALRVVSARSRWPLCIAILGLVGPAWVYPARADEASPADAASEDVDPVTAEMRAHHRRGLELFDEGDYKLALVEFERAYEVGKSYKVLFNIGQVSFQLTRYANARRALERYLAEGGDAISPERRAEVERDLSTLRGRTATLTIRTNVPGAEVAVDDAVLGRAPLEAALVDAGSLRVRVVHEGYVPHVRELRLAGGDVHTITVELRKERSNDASPPASIPVAAIGSWIATGVFAAGAIGTGVAANAAASEYETKRASPIAGSPEQGRADLERQRNLVTGLAVTTDALVVSALIAGGVALYFTLRERPRPNAPRPHARVGWPLEF